MRNSGILLITALLPLLMACQPTTEDAIKYNDGIIEQQNLVNEKFSVLLDTYDAIVPEEMDAAYNDASEQLQKSIAYVNKLKGFESDKYFKEAALKFLNTYKDVLENKHKRIIELYKLPDDKYTEKEGKELETLRDESSAILDKSIDEMMTVQRKFAKKYHIDFES